MKAPNWNVKPSDKEVKSFVRRLSKEYNPRKEELGIVLWDKLGGWYDGNQTIYLPSQESVEYYDPYCEPVYYWGIVIHEFAHYLEHIYNYQEGGHTGIMYSILIGLALSLNYPLDVLWRYENAYKPRSFQRGRLLSGALIMREYVKRTVTNPFTDTPMKGPIVDRREAHDPQPQH